MPRTSRIDIGQEVYHILNRANARAQIFDDDEDYQIFEKILQEAVERVEHNAKKAGLCNLAQEMN